MRLEVAEAKERDARALRSDLRTRFARVLRLVISETRFLHPMGFTNVFGFGTFHERDFSRTIQNVKAPSVRAQERVECRLQVGNRRTFLDDRADGVAYL